MKKINKLIKTKEVIFYGIFGILTTITNVLVFYILHTTFSIDENISNAIAILTAVLFAYFSNKNLVFHSNTSNFKESFLIFSKFILGRAFTMLVEFLGCAILFSTTPFSELIIKIAITIIVIILNFFISKFFAFKK